VDLSIQLRETDNKELPVSGNLIHFDCCFDGNQEDIKINKRNLLE